MSSDIGVVLDLMVNARDLRLVDGACFGGAATLCVRSLWGECKQGY